MVALITLLNITKQVGLHSASVHQATV